MPNIERATAWSLTINNPNEGDDECIALARQKGWKVDGQIEKGDNGTLHYQAIVKTPQVRFSAVKKQFPRAHIEVARNVKALEAYVQKQESRVGALPTSERYITSMKQLWNLVIDTLESASIPKEHRIMFGDTTPYDERRFVPLEAFDYAIMELITEGYYGIETMGINPQTRSAWNKYWKALIYRRQADRQTDRSIVSPSTHNNDVGQEEGYEAKSPTRDGEDNQDSSSEAYGDGTGSEGQESSEEDD